MGTESLRRLVTLLQQPNSLGEHQITGDEAREIWDQATRPQLTDPQDRPIESGEKKILTDLLEGTALTQEARTFLSQMVREQVPQLFAEASPPSPSQPPESNHTLIEGKPLVVTSQGLPLLSLTDAPSPQEKEEGFYQLALLLSQEQQGDLNLDSLKSLPLDVKTKLVENAIALAQDSLNEPADLSLVESNQMRSSAFTVLFGLGRTLPSGTMTAPLSKQIHEALVQLAQTEPHERLANHMARLLNRSDYTQTLNRSQKAQCFALFEARFPQKFDVENLLDEDGYISWEHTAGQGENMYRSFCANLLKKEISGARFKEIDSGPGHRNFELTFDPARGESKGVRIQVREYRSDMFDTVGQKKGFSYGGHSSIGQNQEKSLAAALSKGLKANSPQLAVLDLCAGLDGLDDAMEHLGDVEVLSTFSSSFYWKGTVSDERGSFEGVTKSEGLESLIALWDSLSRNENYEEMRERVGKAIWNWSHSRNPNVVFPTFQDYREVRWMHLDGDDDGRMDANDILYQFGLEQATRAADAEFTFQDNGPPDGLNGDTVRDAVLDLNVSSHYNSVTHRNANAEHVFMANGYFDGSQSDEFVRITKGLNMDGEEVVEITINSRLAHTSREALSALVQYEVMMQLTERGDISITDPVDQKLMGLTFAVFRLNYDAKSRFNDQRIWKQLLKTMRLPSTMPYGPLARLIASENHDYAGSLKMVREYKKLLSEDVVQSLQTLEVGRPGFGPPIS